MGLLLSRFRRKKTTYQQLEVLEKKIRSIEQYGQSTELQKRHVVGTLVVFSIGFYVIAVIGFYIYFRLTSWQHVIFYLIPLFAFPFAVVLLRFGLSRYYEWKLGKNKSKLVILRGEKKKILDEVMDKETYKRAKEILEKFGDPDKQVEALPLSPKSSKTSLVPIPNSAAIQLRYRQTGPVSALNAYNSPNQSIQKSRNDSSFTKDIGSFSKGITPYSKVQLPRPILPVGGGAFDRLVDYLVGDGPGSRYALICSKCSEHNGMALLEEFEYLSYKCAFCHTLNPARKQKPKAPPLVSTPIRTPSKLKEYNLHSGSDSDYSIDDKKHDLVDSDTDVSITNEYSQKEDKTEVIENGNSNISNVEITEEESTKVD